MSKNWLLMNLCLLCTNMYELEQNRDIFVEYAASIVSKVKLFSQREEELTAR